MSDEELLKLEPVLLVAMDFAGKVPPRIRAKVWKKIADAFVETIND